MKNLKKKKGPKTGTIYKDIKRTDLGRKIYALRMEKGLSQQDLADRTGLTKRMISYYERESDTIPIKKLHIVAKALNISLDRLVDGKINKLNLETNKALLKRLEKVKKLPPKKQKVIIDLVDNLSN